VKIAFFTTENKSFFNARSPEGSLKARSRGGMQGFLATSLRPSATSRLERAFRRAGVKKKSI
jgi:hypothetical protein